MKDEYKPVFRAALGFNWKVVRASGGRKLHILQPGDGSGFRPAVCGTTPAWKWSRPPTWLSYGESALDHDTFQECQKCVKWYHDNVG